MQSRENQIDTTKQIQLFHGDCMELMKDIPDGSVDMILCDLPYGTTACKWDSVIPFAPMWEQYKRVAKKNAAIVLTASQPFTSALVMSNPKAFRYSWIWEKGKATGHLSAKRMPMKKHEDVLVFSEIPPRYFPQGLIEGVFLTARPAKLETNGEVYGDKPGREYAPSRFGNYPKSILKFSGEHKPVHPTQKPVALMEYLIKTYTQDGDLVLDNCMGSGTTGVACVNTGRKFIGIEQLELFYTVAQARIESAQMFEQAASGGRLSNE
jgi:site-specific DNA-methyltransferase (adenine-specific)